METIYKNIFSDPLDEEKTYVLILRFVTLNNYLLATHPDTNFVRIVFGKKIEKVKQNLERLERKLISRYSSRESEESGHSTSTLTSTLSDTDSPPAKLMKTEKELIFGNGKIETKLRFDVFKLK